ncbi:TetR/AcrR family transcriptional regulator [Bradyrhizobium sp. AUGA SZCCT0431]|uniref:TetR/AcrR family transcriptional regulator n=1 Tax=Bradyrhizobium sp. AUGA SZCCT0431 TaxID=2807674 RepID=UPI001BA78770|nr:TetR/AcrR family transcriptional regulator [Bradyrhizobium sp. AUGA SZCCT0431]MBR1146647.1 TetR/AcrR family transcriptional regulator [Bradyrhizobium sp. AUGA SZCCT0431]
MGHYRPDRESVGSGVQPAGAPDRGQKRLGGRSARVRDSVLKSAFEVLTENGFENFTIGEVSARANVHETSIYRRWGSRQSLALEASLHFAEDAISAPDTGTLRSDLVSLMGRVVALLHTPQGQAMLALIELRDENLQRARQEYWRRRFERLQPIFDRAISRGEFPKDADPIVFVQTLIAPLYFRLLVTAEKIDDWPVAELIDRLLSGYGYTNSSRSILNRRDL